MPVESGGGSGSGRKYAGSRRMAKPGGNPSRPKGPGNYAKRTVRKAGAGTSSNAWRPVISKEGGAGVRTGNTFKSISGKTSYLSGPSSGVAPTRKLARASKFRITEDSPLWNAKTMGNKRGSSTRQSISDFNKRTNRGK